jgi:DNA-directed RNA polymerase III subunit RPC7
MSRGGRGGGFGRGGGGGGPQSGAMQLVSFDLLKDLGSGNLFNVNTALFPVSIPISSFHVCV